MKSAHLQESSASLPGGEGSAAENFEEEVKAGRRFEFGKNWRAFLQLLSEERIARAEKSIAGMLQEGGLLGKSFLDIGCGSGLFSLAAKRMGARVHSFDFDPNSVACCRELRNRFFPSEDGWAIEQGSVLDLAYLHRLGTYDVVYSWGVLHHTGNMWEAIRNAASLVKPGGKLYIAIYNDQGWKSRVWTWIKALYNRLPSLGKAGFSIFLFALLQFIVILKYSLMLKPWKPFVSMLKDKESRGMAYFVDWKDWIGGYPFEVASPERINGFLQGLGFALIGSKTVRTLGCNEFVFSRDRG